MKTKLENIKSWYLLIAFFIGAIITTFIGIYKIINRNSTFSYIEER